MHVLIFRLALSQLRQKPISRILVILSVGCVLTANAAVFVLFKGFSRALVDARNSYFITAYLDQSVTAAKETNVVSAVRKIPGVSSVQLVSKETFTKNFSHYFPQLKSELEALDGDAIPRYIKVKVQESPKTSIETIRQKLKAVPEIETVEANSNRFSSLMRVLSVLKSLSLAMIAGMSLALFCIFINHFKLTTSLEDQVHKTLSILGAKRGHVIAPFACVGFLEGTLGGLIAALVLHFFGSLFQAQFEGLFLSMGYKTTAVMSFNVLALGALGMGALLGMMVSIWTVLRIRTA